MQYYIFKEACDTKETGPVYPQIQKWKPGYDDDKPDSYYSYYTAAKSGDFPDFTPDLDSLIIHGRAKPTDIMSSVISTGFIISKKLKVLFDQFVFPPHRFYPAKVLHKKIEIGDYYFMHIISNYSDFVNYPKSTFINYGFADSDPRSITVISKQDFLSKNKMLQDDSYLRKLPYRTIGVKEIYLSSNFDRVLELQQ